MRTEGRDAPVHVDLPQTFLLSTIDSPVSTPQPITKPLLEWDWDVEHADRRSEAQADARMQHGHGPFEVDRKVLKDVVREKMGCEVGRIKFLSSGTFHKAYLVTLADSRELVARVARRFMPRLKTSSEVATLQYLRENTPIPVPAVYHHDANPYNRLGGEYILMSKAPGVPLSKVYHSMAHEDLVDLLKNIANIVIPLFAHRFPSLGSLYSPSNITEASSSAQTPTATHGQYSLSRSHSQMGAFDFGTPKISQMARPPLISQKTVRPPHFSVGPIISWPFFGSNRGDDPEIDRGPWTSTHAYLSSCMEREIQGVIREAEGKSAPHRLHLDPDEIHSSRHHHLQAVPGDESDESEDWDMEESEEEWDGPGDTMYRDYRRMQRSTFLVAHVVQREQDCRNELERWVRVMEKLGVNREEPNGEVFGLDCHDLSLENIFVDEQNHSKITCIIDWESTTTRPLWATAHLPAFLLSSPFTAKLFREAVASLTQSKHPSNILNTGIKSADYDLASLASEWLHYERHGTRLRMAHRCAEWDGWEEGLVESILGPEDLEDEWFREGDATATDLDALSSPPNDISHSQSEKIIAASLKRLKPTSKLPFTKEEEEKERVLNMTGDICGGRGGELGRRLEAWLSVNGTDESEVSEVKPRLKRWDEDEDVNYEAEAE